MIFNDIEDLLYSTLKRNGSLYHPSSPYSMYVKGVQGRKLLDPVFKRKTHGVIDVVAHAREAELRVDSLNRQLLLHMKFGVATTPQGPLVFVDQIFPVEIPAGIDKYENRRPRDMTWQEMLDRREELWEELAHVRGETEAAATIPGQEQHAKNLKEKQKPIKQLLQHLYVEMLMRPALSVGCLCFVLVACPVAVWFSRGDYLGSFITVFMPIVISYYPLVLCGTNMAKEARYNEIALVFGPNILVGIVGLCLMRWLVKY
jgi:lipopolysaccharide export system permease protein